MYRKKEKRIADVMDDIEKSHIFHMKSANSYKIGFDEKMWKNGIVRPTKKNENDIFFPKQI